MSLFKELLALLSPDKARIRHIKKGQSVLVTHNHHLGSGAAILASLYDVSRRGLFLTSNSGIQDTLRPALSHHQHISIRQQEDIANGMHHIFKKHYVGVVNVEDVGERFAHEVVQQFISHIIWELRYGRGEQSNPSANRYRPLARPFIMVSDVSLDALNLVITQMNVMAAPCFIHVNDEDEKCVRDILAQDCLHIEARQLQSLDVNMDGGLALTLKDGESD